MRQGGYLSNMINATTTQTNTTTENTMSTTTITKLNDPQAKFIPAMTEATKTLFIELVNDAGEWDGRPLIGGNVTLTKEQRGNLTNMKRLDLITTHFCEGCTWVTFTDKGRHAAFALCGFDPDPDADNRHDA